VDKGRVTLRITNTDGMMGCFNNIEKPVDTRDKLGYVTFHRWAL